jgi:hypothetical protein
MWLKFDLTDGEIEQICRKAGKGEKLYEVREYYRNVRRNIFEKLDIITHKFVTSTGITNVARGWLRPGTMEGLPQNPKCPQPPSREQIQASQVITPDYVRKAWQFINILDDSVWTDTGSDQMILAASRTATYVKYRAASLHAAKNLTHEEKTKM